MSGTTPGQQLDEVRAAPRASEEGSQAGAGVSAAALSRYGEWTGQSNSRGSALVVETSSLCKGSGNDPEPTRKPLRQSDKKSDMIFSVL